MLYSGRIFGLITGLLLLFFSLSSFALSADFTATPSSGTWCAPVSVSFTNLSSGATSYDWDFGDGTTPHPSITSPSHTYAAAGTYHVVLTAYNGSSSTTKTVTITIYSAPTVYFRASDTAVCVCNNINFFDSCILNAPGTGTYNWQFGNGDTSSAHNPIYAYCTASTTGYSVILKATNSAGCFSSLTKPYYIHVYQHPAISFSANKTIICGLSGIVNFTSAISGGPSPYTYEWDFGDGSSHSFTANPTHNYSATTYGSYTVTLIVTTRAGCKDTIVQSNYITLTHVAAAFNTTPLSSMCSNEYLIATNSSIPTFDSTGWEWGDGSSSDGNPAAHLYAAGGTYTVTLVTKNGTCYDSTTKTITVHQAPVVRFGGTPLNPCAAPQSINFTDSTSGTIATRSWDFGDGSSPATSATPSHTYSSNGNYDVKLVITNSYGCADSLIKLSYINIYALGVQIKGNGHLGVVGGCIPFIDTFTCSATSVAPAGVGSYPYAIDSIWWHFGDGDSSRLRTPIHTYTTYGTFTVTARIQTHNGCFAIDSFSVKTGPHPTANFSASPTTGCVNQVINFTDMSDSATDYEWHFGDGGSTDFTKNPIHRFSDTGHYSVMEIVHNNGCPDTLIKTHYITINLPKATFGFQYICDTPKKIKFSDSSKGASTHDWNFGDGSAHSTATNPTHTYSGPGTYTVVLVVTNTVSGCTDSTSTTLVIYVPSITLSASDTFACLNVPIKFTGTITGVTALKYSWLYDYTTLLYDTTTVVYFAFNKTGYHSVKYIVNDIRGCVDTFSRIHYIGIAKPVVDFKGTPVTGCQPLNVYFSDLTTDISGVTLSTRTWDYGDGSPFGSGASPSHIYAAVGSYYVQLKVTDNIGCTDSTVKTGYIQVHKPTANFFGSPIRTCPGNPVIFTSTSAGLPLTYLWRFGDGTTSTLVTDTHSYTSTGTYTVTLIVTDTSGCKDSMVKINYITVITKPTASFTLDDSFSICPPLVVNFTNHSTGATNYQWYFGDPLAGGPSPLTSPSWTYTTAGIYNVILVAYNSSGCTDTARATVRLLGYKGAFSYAPLRGCAPLTVNFAVKVKGVPDFIYDFDDGTTKKDTSTTMSHTYTAPGPHIPKLIMTDDKGCSSESVGLDTVFVDGVYHGFYVTPYPTCDSGTIQFIDTSRGAYSAIIKRRWYFHDGATSSIFNPYHTYHGPGVYSVILIDSTTSGCVDTFNSNVTFYQLPTIKAGSDTTICLGDSATLSPAGGIVYTWSPAATLSCSTCYNPKASPAIKTIYTVIGKDIHGCKNKDSVTVSIKTKTTSVATGGGEICQGQFLQLTDSAGPYSTYKWVPPYGLNDPHNPSPLANPDSTILYEAIAQQAGCAPDTQYVNVIIHPRPVINLGPNKQITAGDGVQITAVGTNLYKLLWHPAESLTCDTCISATATPKDKKTIYTVSATSDFGCQDSANVTIIVVCDQSQVFMPNTFTPNGDGQNDIFYPRGKGLRIIRSFRIYNRWGQLMFDKENINTNQKQNGWDGTFKGVPLSSDVFVYIVDAICDTGEPMSWKGDISLIH